MGHAKGIFASGRAEASMLVHKKCCTLCNIFCEQAKTSTMLPQANRVFIGSNVRFEHVLRNLCQMREASLYHQ